MPPPRRHTGPVTPCALAPGYILPFSCVGYRNCLTVFSGPSQTHRSKKALSINTFKGVRGRPSVGPQSWLPSSRAHKTRGCYHLDLQMLWRKGPALIPIPRLSAVPPCSSPRPHEVLKYSLASTLPKLLIALRGHPAFLVQSGSDRELTLSPGAPHPSPYANPSATYLCSCLWTSAPAALSTEKDH